MRLRVTFSAQVYACLVRSTVTPKVVNQAYVHVRAHRFADLAIVELIRELALRCCILQMTYSRVGLFKSAGLCT